MSIWDLGFGFYPRVFSSRQSSSKTAAIFAAKCKAKVDVSYQPTLFHPELLLGEMLNLYILISKSK